MITDDLVVRSVKYHRNGIGGDPFYVIQFEDEEEFGTRRPLPFIGIVPSYFVPNEDGTVGAPFCENSGCIPVYVITPDDPDQCWRGDYYSDRLVQACVDFEKREEERWTTRSRP